MDHTYTKVKCISGRGNADFFSVYKYLTAVGQIYAGKHIHEGGLTAAVFPQQRKNFSFVDIQADLVIGYEGAEGLGNIHHLDCFIRFQTGTSFPLS